MSKALANSLESFWHLADGNSCPCCLWSLSAVDPHISLSGSVLESSTKDSAGNASGLLFFLSSPGETPSMVLMVLAAFGWQKLVIPV